MRGENGARMVRPEGRKSVLISTSDYADGGHCRGESPFVSVKKSPA